MDENIRTVQKKIRSQQTSQQVLPTIEQLGWSYVEKARVSFDPGFYQLAEQCATCLELKSAQLMNAKSQEPTFAPLSPQAAKASAMLLRGHALHALHRFAEAEQIARELTTSRGLAFDFGLLGDVLMEQGKLDDAITAYQRMMELKPSPQAYSRASHVRWLKGDLESARVLMRMSAQASGNGDVEASAWAWSKLALYELQAGQLKQAAASCELALELQPGYAPALLAKGRVLLAERKFNEAVLPLQRAAEKNPLPEYRWTLADALRAAGRNDAFTLDALAWAQTAAGHHDQAWQTMQQVLAVGTNDARIFLHAAVITARIGQPTLARRFAQRTSTMQATLLPGELEHLRQLNL